MATTIQGGFATLARNLEITGLQEATVATRQQNIREALEDELKVLESFLTGSYRRSTLIAPLSQADIDIVAVLDSKYYEQNGQAALLDKVKRVLKKTYPKTPEVSRNGQAVTITFSDFRADVVPAFYRQGGGLLIPDSVRSAWISTDPRKHVEIWTAANADHKGDLIPLIKMIKGWNSSNGLALRSFHLETVVLDTLRGITITDYPSGARWVFDKARAKMRVQVPDPAGYGGDVGAYLNTAQKMDDAVSRLESAYNRALAAEQLASSGYIGQAFEKWRLVFGDYFPVYG